MSLIVSVLYTKGTVLCSVLDADVDVNHVGGDVYPHRQKTTLAVDLGIIEFLVSNRTIKLINIISTEFTLRDLFTCTCTVDMIWSMGLRW